MVTPEADFFLYTDIYAGEYLIKKVWADYSWHGGAQLIRVQDGGGE